MTEPKEALLRNVITHATGGNCTGEGMGLNDICVSISAHRNEVYARGVERGKATLAAENAALRKKLAEMEAVLRKRHDCLLQFVTQLAHAPRKPCTWMQIREAASDLLTQIDALTGGDNAEG